MARLFVISPLPSWTILLVVIFLKRQTAQHRDQGKRPSGCPSRRLPGSPGPRCRGDAAPRSWHAGCRRPVRGQQARHRCSVPFHCVRADPRDPLLFSSQSSGADCHHQGKGGGCCRQPPPVLCFPSQPGGHCAGGTVAHQGRRPSRVSLCRRAPVVGIWVLNGHLSHAAFNAEVKNISNLQMKDVHISL